MKKKPLKVHAICTITYRESRRKLRGQMTGPSLESVARKLGSIADYWMSEDSEMHGPAKTVAFSFRPLLSTTPKAKKKS